MAKYLVSKSSLKGEIACPASKSQTMRAILFATLAKGESKIYNYLDSEDTFFMIKVCELFGAKIKVLPTYLLIEGVDRKISGAEGVIDAGNSGIILRFITAIAALGSKNIVITGDRSIREQRPMKPLLDALRELDVKAISIKENDFAPIIIKGPLKPGNIIIEGQDSQYISALLIALSFSNSKSEIIVKNPGEKPWVTITLNWLDRFKIPYVNFQFEKYQLFGKAKINAFNYSVPSDFSTLAFPLAAAIITDSELTIKNIDMKDPQGDKKLIDVFQKMGAKIDINEKEKILQVKKGSVLKGITVDINDFIDAITILAVVACFAKGETKIVNAKVARTKECDRIKSVFLELKKMKADIKETADGLIIKKSKLKGAKVFSHHDHRMAMSLAVAAFGADGITTIDSVKCISKTFPTFLKDFNELGADITEVL